MHIVLVVAGGGELWLGSIQAGGDSEYLRRNGITALVNCSNGAPMARAAGLKQLGTFDGVGIMTGHVKWYSVIAMLDAVGQELRNGGRVLLSCKSGTRRSSLVAALVLCFLCGIAPNQAMNHITKIRELCDFVSVVEKKPTEGVRATPGQFLLSKQSDLRAAHDALEGHERFMLNCVMTPSEYLQFAMVNSVVFPDMGLENATCFYCVLHSYSNNINCV